MKLNYHALWNLMAEVIRDLKMKGESVPSRIMKDLRSAKTMMEISKIDRSNPEVIRRIEEYLNNVESFLLPIAKEKLGQKYADELIDKITEAQRTTSSAEGETERRFPVGAPRDKHWIRIKPTDDLSSDLIRQISGDLKLKCEVQDDGYILIYGEKEQIKKFVKRTAEHMTRGKSSNK